MQLDVLIPTFNRADSLARTLDSLQSARIPAGMSVTVTVINNNCTDGTEALVTARMRNDDRIRWLGETIRRRPDRAFEHESQFRFLLGFLRQRIGFRHGDSSATAD